MKVLKALLLVLFSISVVLAYNPDREAKLKEVQEARKAPKTQIESSIMAASSDWAPVTLGLNGLTVLSIDYRANGVIWANGWVGSQDYTFYSSDHGASWSKKAMPPTTNVGYVNISAQPGNDSVAVIANYDGIIFRTDDRGATWDTVYSYAPVDTGFFDGIKFVDANTVYAVGDADWYGMHLVKSTDAGLTWTRMLNIPAEVKGAVKVYAAAGLGKIIDGIGNNVWVTYYMASSANRVGVPLVRTTDGGATWTHHVNKLNDAVGNVNYYFRSITFKDANNGWGIGRRTGTLDYPLYKTTDGGVTWGDTIPIEPGVPLSTNKVRNIHPIGGMTNFVAVGQVGSVAGSWLSTDGGATFTKMKSPSVASEFRGAGGYDLTHMFAGGTGATGLYKYQPSVKVTFAVNTAGVPDTLKANSFVQIRGGAAQITWGMDSPAKLVNTTIGGKPSDYWTYTGFFPVGASFSYKFFTYAAPTLPPADEHKGWEGNISISSNDRTIVVGDNDTTLPIQYVNGFAEKPGQYAAPFDNTEDDTVVVFLKVNMQGAKASLLFDPAKHKLGVRGGFPASNWGTSIIMTPMAEHPNGGSRQYDASNLYTAAIKFQKSTLNNTEMKWKYVIHKIDAPVTEDWSVMVDNPDGDVGVFTMPAKDTTTYWTWYRNQPFIAPKGQDTIFVQFRTDFSNALVQKGWKPGDSIVVKYGFGSSAEQIFTVGLVKTGFTGNAHKTDTLLVPGVAVGVPLQYQYYRVDGDLREIFYDYAYAGADAGAAERRKIDVAAKNATVVIYDTSKAFTSMRKQPIWQNTSKLSRDVTVTYTVDLRPAYYHLANGDSLDDVQNAFRDLGPGDKDSVYTWGVWMNGPAVGGWSNPSGNDWGVGLRANLNKKMYDDGTNGDAVAGDHIYTRQVFYKNNDTNTVGQVFKFGLYGGDNEGGKGGFGNNHVENIDDAAATATIASQFGSINPSWFRAWNYDTKEPVLNVERDGDVVPMVYALEQNYPNPFNPTTSIKYSIPVTGFVTLKVFNILGQEVITLVNESLEAGAYTASFNASTLSSGVYLYKIESGSFTSVKKMMLLK